MNGGCPTAITSCAVALAILYANLQFNDILVLYYLVSHQLDLHNRDPLIVAARFHSTIVKASHSMIEQ